MQKRRHSKFKNTGILFELLTKQVTADIIAGKDTSAAKDLIYKYFRENTELGREWHLYSTLLNEKIKDEPHAERFFSVILEARKKLNNKKLSLVTLPPPLFLTCAQHAYGAPFSFPTCLAYTRASSAELAEFRRVPQSSA